MASLKRNEIIARDYPMSKFLYFILKQMDLKSIDWNQVAEDCEISNGHAARMRFSRFKGQMEDTAPAQRRGRPPTDPDKTGAGVKKARGRVGAKAATSEQKTSLNVKHADYKIEPERSLVFKDPSQPAPKIEPSDYQLVKREHECLGEPIVDSDYYDYHNPWLSFGLGGFPGSQAAMNDRFDQDMAPWFILQDMAESDEGREFADDATSQNQD